MVQLLSDLSLTTNFFIMWECSSLIKRIDTENAALHVFPQFPPTYIILSAFAYCKLNIAECAIPLFKKCGFQQKIYHQSTIFLSFT